MLVPSKVEEKIRYLINKFPHTEWSGILFFTHTGSFEDNTLTLTCEDLLLMDVGTSGWTDFEVTPDVATYIAENPDLFFAEMGLIHSHHTLGAFLSGQDLKTVQIEGNKTNNFVSLVVDTKGEYVATITRKRSTTKEIITTCSKDEYSFFDAEPVILDSENKETKETIKEEYIEHFMLDVEREVVENPLAYLDTRVDKVMKEKEVNNQSEVIVPPPSIGMPGSDYDLDYENYSIQQHSSSSKEDTQLTLWGEEEPGSAFLPQECVQDAVLKIITCDILVDGEKMSYSNMLPTWIKQDMETDYKIFFHDYTSCKFVDWRDYIVDAIITQYCTNRADGRGTIKDDKVVYRFLSDIHKEIKGLCKFIDKNSPCQYYLNDYLTAIDEVRENYVYE